MVWGQGQFVAFAVLSSLQVALTRHAVLPNEEPLLVDRKDYTVDSRSTADMYSPMDTAKLFVTLRSPTTQLVVFSPDRMPIDRTKLESPFANKTLYKFQLKQRACKMASGATSPDACYEDKFDTKRPMSLDRVFEFYRFAGTGGADPNDVLMMEASSSMASGTPLQTQWRQRGFRGCAALEAQCNNHRAVSIPGSIREMYPRIDWNDVFYNDAEFMESTVFTNPPNLTEVDPNEAERCVPRPRDCQWTPRTIEFLQEVLPIAKGFEAARKREGQWLGDFLSYRRLPDLEYLHLLRTARKNLPTVTLAMIAAGSVEDYPANVTALLRARFATAAGVPSYGVKVTVKAASVKITATIFLTTDDQAANISGTLSALIGSSTSASTFTGLQILSAPNVTQKSSSFPSSSNGNSTGSGAATDTGGSSPGSSSGADDSTSDSGDTSADQSSSDDTGGSSPGSSSGADDSTNSDSASDTSSGADDSTNYDSASDTGQRRLMQWKLAGSSTTFQSTSTSNDVDGAELSDEDLPTDAEVIAEIRRELMQHVRGRRKLQTDDTYDASGATSYGAGGGSYAYGDSTGSYGGSYGGAAYSYTASSYDPIDLPPGIDEIVAPTSRPPKISPTAGEQLHPNNLNIDQGRWDHHIEICAFEGDCDSTTARCINNYEVALVNADLPGQEPVNTLYQEYRQFPAEGAGDLLTLRATASEGPFAPCPVGDDGRQVPCAPLEMLYRGARISGFEPPNNLRFYVENIELTRVAAINDASFTLVIAYDITWSDRYAVHPCTIPLYSYGQGVPSSGKLVPASKWWKPHPAKGSNAAINVVHSKNLRVHHTISTADEVGRPGPAVTTACTVLSCPWPKQLFLRNRISAEVQVSASWDYTQFPFDKQMIRMRLPILDGDRFTAYDINEAIMNITLPLESVLEARYGQLYKPTDWLIYSGRITAEDNDTLVFELKISRNARTTVFKIIIPMLANALLLMLCTRLNADKRLQIVSLSMVVAGTMLNPAFLGLPSTVSGIPFVQSLVVIHMVCAMVVMGYTFSIAYTDWKYEVDIEREKRKYKKSMDRVWQKHAGNYSKWAMWFKKKGSSDAPTFGAVEIEPEMEDSKPKKEKKELSTLFGSLGAAKTPTKPSAAPAVAVISPDPEDPSLAYAEKAADAESMQSATVELLLSLPALFHRQDPTRPPSIYNPFGELRPGFLPRYNYWLKKRKYTQRTFVGTMPWIYFSLWAIDILIYFAFYDGEPK